MDLNNISMNKYIKNLVGVILIGVGAFLMMEHIWTWGSFQLFDFLGHEYLGVLFIVIGILINLNISTPVSKELVNLWNWIKNGFTKKM